MTALECDCPKDGHLRGVCPYLGGPRRREYVPLPSGRIPGPALVTKLDGSTWFRNELGRETLIARSGERVEETTIGRFRSRAMALGWRLGRALAGIFKR